MSPIERIRARSEAQTILGLKGQPTADEVRRAYRTKAFEAHPDRAGGSAGYMAAINAAYSLLTGQAEYVEPPKPVAPIRPVRPGTKPRVMAVDDVTQARAQRTLAETRTEDSTDHVAITIRKVGRKLTYLVPTRLREGRNRVALPAEVLALPPRNTQKIVSFRTSNVGRGQITLPEQRVALDFPGASEVTILFGVTAV